MLLMMLLTLIVTPYPLDQPRVQLWTDHSEIKTTTAENNAPNRVDCDRLIEIDDFNSSSSMSAEIDEFSDFDRLPENLVRNTDEILRDGEYYGAAKVIQRSNGNVPYSPHQPHRSTTSSRGGGGGVASDYNDPSAALGFDVKRSFVIGRGRSSRTGHRSRNDNRPKFK